jgi:hypothetical protein
MSSLVAVAVTSRRWDWGKGSVDAKTGLLDDYSAALSTADTLDQQDLG